jgi:hypothetical protein
MGEVEGIAAALIALDKIVSEKHHLPASMPGCGKNPLICRRHVPDCPAVS